MVIAIIVTLVSSVFCPALPPARQWSATDTLILVVELPDGASARLGTASGGRVSARRSDQARTLVLAPTTDGEVMEVVVSETDDVATGGGAAKERARLYLRLGESAIVTGVDGDYRVKWDGILTKGGGGDGLQQEPCTRCCIYCGDREWCGCKVETSCGSCCCPAACSCDSSPGKLALTAWASLDPLQRKLERLQHPDFNIGVQPQNQRRGGSRH
jgi:hypothetical protein